MALSNDTLDIRLNINYNVKSYSVTDLYDYVAEGIALADLESNIKVTSPAGDVIYDGVTTPDWDDPYLDLDVSTTGESKTLSGSLDDDTGEILEGDYVIDYLLRRKFAAVQILTTTSVIVTGEFDDTQIPIGSSIDLEGWTNASNNKTVTVAAVVPGAGFTSITVLETLITETTAAFAYLRFEHEFSFCYEFEPTDIDIETSHKCSTSRLSTEDITVYSDADTIVGRAWTIKSPIKADGSNVVPDVTSTASYVKIKPIYTGGYQIALSVSLTRLLLSGIIVTYTAGATETHVVTCNSSLVSAYACIKEAYQKLSDACGCGRVPPFLSCLIQELNNEIQLANLAGEAGNENAVDEHITNVYAILSKMECDCSPSDNDAEPVLVVSSVYSIQLAAADVTYDNSVTGSIYTNAQSLFDYLLGLPQGGGVVKVNLSEVTHPTEFSGYTTDVDFDFVTSADAIIMEFDYSSTNAGGTIGFKKDGIDVGISCLVGVSTGRARVIISRKNANIKYTIQADAAGVIVSTGFIVCDFTVPMLLTPYWSAQAGVGKLRGNVTTRVKGALI